MTDSDLLADAFEENREHLRAVAYRLLGSMSDADDAVQDTWLRLTGADASQVENLGGWLTTVVAPVSLNMLRSPRRPPAPAGGGPRPLPGPPPGGAPGGPRPRAGPPAGRWPPMRPPSRPAGRRCCTVRRWSPPGRSRRPLWPGTPGWPW